MAYDLQAKSYALLAWGCLAAAVAVGALSAASVTMQEPAMVALDDGDSGKAARLGRAEAEARARALLEADIKKSTGRKRARNRKG